MSIAEEVAELLEACEAEELDAVEASLDELEQVRVPVSMKARASDFPAWVYAYARTPLGLDLLARWWGCPQAEVKRRVFTGFPIIASSGPFIEPFWEPVTGGKIFTI